MKREFGAWWYNRATLSLVDTNTGPSSSTLEVGRKAVKNCCEIQRNENWAIQMKRNLAESSKEGYGSENVGLSMMMISP
jgi:hypothetical protein